MAMKFQLRGDSRDAYFAAGLKGHAVQGGTDANIPITTTAIAGVWGGKMLDMSQRKALSFSGAHNWANGTNTFTIHMRIVPQFTGDPSTFQSFMQIATAFYVYAGLLFGCDGGPAYIAANNADTSGIFGGYLTGTNLPFVSGQAIDIYLRGNNTHLELFTNVDGAVAASIASVTTAATAVRPNFLANSLMFGAFDGRPADISIVSASIWDTYEDPVAFGVLADHPATPAIGEGLALKSDYSDPGVAHVEILTPYRFEGANLIGTLATTGPSAADVAAAVWAAVPADNTDPDTMGKILKDAKTFAQANL